VARDENRNRADKPSHSKGDKADKKA
jgi:hypothetical protein